MIYKSFTPIKKVDINSNAFPSAGYRSAGFAPDGYYAYLWGFLSLHRMSIYEKTYIFNVDFALMDFIEDPLGQIGEELGDVGTSLGRSSEEWELRFGRVGGDRLKQV